MYWVVLAFLLSFSRSLFQSLPMATIWFHSHDHSQSSHNKGKWIDAKTFQFAIKIKSFTAHYNNKIELKFHLHTGTCFIQNIIEIEIVVVHMSLLSDIFESFLWFHLEREKKITIKINSQTYHPLMCGPHVNSTVFPRRFCRMARWKIHTIDIS